MNALSAVDLRYILWVIAKQQGSENHVIKIACEVGNEFLSQKPKTDKERYAIYEAVRTKNEKPYMDGLRRHEQAPCNS